MSFATKHNPKGRLFNFDIPAEFEYVNLSQLVNKHGLNTLYKVNALYINSKSKYGKSPVIVTDNALVNAPQHMLDTVNDIINDGESVSMINRGMVGFKIYEYRNNYGVNYGIEWVDLVPNN